MTLVDQESWVIRKACFAEPGFQLITRRSSLATHHASVKEVQHAVEADVIDGVRRLCPHRRLGVVGDGGAGLAYVLEIVRAVADRDDLFSQVPAHRALLTAP